MFDEKYFKTLYKETKDLLCIDAAEDDTIKCNIAILKTLAEEIEDENLKTEILHKINDMKNNNVELDFKIKEVKEEQNETKMRLERDLLKYSRTLRKKANKFDDAIGEDKKVLDLVGEKFSENINSANFNIKKLYDKVSNISIVKMFLIVFVIFIAMYFFIRFI